MFLDSLLREMELRQHYLPDKNIRTLYFGGGTPSLMTFEECEEIVKGVKRYFNTDTITEFTFEANPEQLSKEYLQQLRKLGVNRISIGVQSLHDSVLKILKRGHTAQMAARSVENACSAGFENISVDLIYGIEERKGREWEMELEKVASWPVTHISAYSLTVEENTLLYRKVKKGERPFPEEERAAREFEIMLEYLRDNGFQQYEISNFAKEGYISRHNFSYWQHIPYLGLGPSAHSFDGHSRQWNVADIARYERGVSEGKPDFEREVLTPEIKLNEYLLLHLRTYQGIDLDTLGREFGKDQALRICALFEKISKSYYLFKDNSFILTDSGKLFADAIALELFV